MLEQQINEVLSKHNVQLTQALKADLSSLFLADSKTVMDTLELTIFESQVNLQAEAWTLIEDQENDIPEAAETLFFEELEQEDVPISTPQLMLGRYDDLGELGAGGMGEVRKIRDRTLNRTLAMKIIHSQKLSKQNVRARFIEEAQIGAQLQHPNIIPIHEMGQLNDGRLYFTMKEVKGRSFGEAIKEVHDAIENKRWRITKSGWSFRRLINAFHDVCKAVAYAHSKGVLHRDLKPENIMLGEYGEVLVVDWGIAKVLGGKDWAVETGELDGVFTDRSLGANTTRLGQVAGTPAYMSPEQARGEIDKLDGRTDVYALGAILYEILTGSPAYQGKSGIEVLQKVLLGPPESIRTTSTSTQKDVSFFDDFDVLESIEASGVSLPEELIVACERSMQRDRGERYASVSELVRAISDWLDGAKKREQALKVVEEAMALTQKREKLEKQSRHLLEEVEEGLKDIPIWESEAVKADWWEKEREAHDLHQESQLLDIVQEQQLQAALTHKSDLEEAHVELANRYKRVHEKAEIDLQKKLPRQRFV